MKSVYIALTFFLVIPIQPVLAVYNAMDEIMDDGVSYPYVISYAGVVASWVFFIGIGLLFLKIILWGKKAQG